MSDDLVSDGIGSRAVQVGAARFCSQKCGKEQRLKLEDMILVIENRKGTETMFLLGLPDYMEMVLKACDDSALDMADAIKQLYDSQKDWTQCSELYFAGNKSCQARFCVSEAQLRGFLMGIQEDGTIGEKPVFDEQRCNTECLEVLKAYGMEKDGHSLFNSLHYEMAEHDFHAGEIVRNLNGNDYRILEVLSPKNLLLMSVNTGELMVGVNTQYYQRTPKEGYTSPDSVICGIEWGQGVYLGSRIMNISFEDIRSSYGIPKEQETLAQYRDRLKHEFRLYESLKDNTNVSHEMREAAWKSQGAVFETEDFETFCAFLDKGFYDYNFRGIVPEEQQKENKQEKLR